MDQETFSLFPTGVRTLIVDDNARFLKKASKLLPLLNFKVATCTSPTSALELLIGERLKDVDVVLIDARKAMDCGFDFRGIVEFDLCIPVVYCKTCHDVQEEWINHVNVALSKDHEAKGNKVDEVLHTLGEATYIIRRPLDVDILSNLCRVIAWRKCYLDAQAKGVGNKHASFEAVRHGSTFNDYDDDEEEEDVEEEHIHVNALNDIGRRRRSYTLEYLPLMVDSTFDDNNSEDDYDDDGDDVAATANGGGGGDDDDNDDQEEEEEHIHPQGSYSQKRKSGNNISPESSSSTNFAGGLLTQRLEQMDITEGRERDNLVSHQQVSQHRQSFSVPSYNPKIFEDFAGPSNNVEFFPNTNNNVVPAPVLEPCPAYQQQQPWALNIFNNTAPPLAAVSTMATTVTYEPQFSHDKQQQDICLPLMAGPFPWPLVMQQDMFQPQTESCRIQPGPFPLAGDIFTVMTGAGAFGGASMTTAEAGVYGNIDNLHIRSVNLDAEQQGDDQLAAMMMDMHTNVDSAMVPQHVGITTKEKAPAMPYHANGSNVNHNAGSLVALNEVHGMASNVIDPAMAGRGSNDASLVAPQGLFIEAPNGNQLALGDNMDGSPMGLVQSPGTVLDFKSNLAAIFSSPWYEENDFFPVEALLGQQDAPMHDVAFDGRQVDATDNTNCDTGDDGGSMGKLG